MDQPKPGDYSIGSLESRAAARLQMGRLRDSRRRIEITSNAFGPEDKDRTIPYATEWNDCGDVLMRRVYLPTQWEKSPTAPVPICRGCGTPYRKREDHPGFTIFEADCVAKHVSD